MAPLKFPTSASPFPRVELTDGDCRLYEQRAETLVRNALAEYDEYDTVNKRQLDLKQWRAVKTRENLTVYRKRPSRDSSSASTGGRTRKTPASVAATLALGATKIGGWLTNADKEGGDWSLPPMLAVGSIAGTLDDVMYGIGTFDSTAMFLKASYTNNEIQDGEVLYSIKTPTSKEPFQFVGLKWIVKTQPVGVSAIVWPRDVVYLEATGILQRPNGERVGYQLIHSVNLAECDELRSKGVLRATVSSCFLFKQMPKGVVDVYMKAHVEPNGKVSSSIAVKSTAASLIYCWKSVSCAQHKKLAYKFMKKEKQYQQRVMIESSTPSRRGSQLSSCGLCSKSMGKFRHAIKCELCDEPVCSKCRVTKKLSFIGSWAKDVTQRSVVCCTKCVSHASQTSAFTIASDEVVASCWEEIRKDALRRSTSNSDHSSRSSECTTTAWHHSDRSVGDLFPVMPSPVDPTSDSNGSDWKPRFSHSFDITVPISEPRFQEIEIGGGGAFEGHRLHATDEELDGTLEDPEQLPPYTTATDFSKTRRVPLAASMAPKQAVTQETPVLTHQQQLWLQMAELRSQAESVYQYTKKNAEEHLNSNASARSLQLED
ncbi:hypothetical protein Gpo141_00000819 [Globisporangium polare]